VKRQGLQGGEGVGRAGVADNIKLDSTFLAWLAVK
jgi:hypothetical protein